MSARVLRKGLPVALAIASLVGAAQAGAAMPWWHLNVYSAPAKPGPARPARGIGTVTLQVTNLGDAATKSECVKAAIAEKGPFNDSQCTQPAEPVFRKKGEGEWERKVAPITIVDTLPEGVSVAKTEIHTGTVHIGAGEPDITALGQNVQEGANSEGVVMPCTLAGRTVRCTYEGGSHHRPLPAYEALTVAINVEVEKGKGDGVNEVSVEGGGVAPVTAKKALALSDTPPPFGVATYELTPEEEGGLPDTQAGSHPFQLTFTIGLNAQTVPVSEAEGLEEYPQVQPIGSFTKDLRFNLPPGLVGNPVPLPKCNTKVFLEEGQVGGGVCPADTVVGVASAVTAGSIPEGPFFTNPLYSLEPSVGEPARFGFQTGAGPAFIDVSVRTGGDYAVVGTVHNITQSLELLSSQVTFWGVPGDPRHDTARGKECLAHLDNQQEISCAEGGAETPFLVMPTSCTGPLQTSVEGDTWQQRGQFTAPKEYKFQNSEGELLQQNGCDALNFNPSISVSPDGTQGSSPTGLQVGVHVAQDASLAPTGLAESALKDTTVALPAGVTLNPAAADGLMACGLGEIALESPAEQTCPEASKVGTVKIKTPLLPNELEGSAYLAAQNANPFGSLVALYISVFDPVSGVRVRFAGEVKPDPVTGQLVSTFKNTPQLPFEDLTLHFFGGSRAPLGTPAACGSYTTTASFAPWSGNPAANVSSPPFNITSGPGGSPCSNPLPFNPSLQTGSLNLQAGAFTPLTTTMSREDGQQPLQGVQLHFPPGLSGLLSGVALCGEQQANEGTCGPGSLIGETTVSVGLGGNPFAVKGGRVYITGPYKGAPFGLSIVNPAKAGPFDLGTGACDCVVVRAKVDVDPSTAALTVTTDDTGPYRIPTILDGIPLQIKHVNVLINRPGFTINPTSCNKMAVMGSIVSTEGASSTIGVPFQVTNCATLKFAPQFSVSTNARTSKAAGASLTAKVSYPSAPQGTQANLTKVKVDLPLQLPSQLKTLQKACLAKVFEANPALCPPESIVGHAKVITPLLPVPLVGPAYFVSHGNEDFPSLTIVLQGYGVTIDLVGSTFIKKGITSSTFKTVPDSPFNSFELTLPQGKYAALAANLPANAHGSFCGQNLKMPTLLVAQNGAEIHQQTPITVTGCPKAKTRAQLYAAALTACHKKHNHSKRQACERQARRKYGPVKNKRK
jgi:hypothetical protein